MFDTQLSHTGLDSPLVVSKRLKQHSSNIKEDLAPRDESSWSRENLSTHSTLTEHFMIQFCSIIVFLLILSNLFEESEMSWRSMVKVKNAPLIVPLKESWWLVIDHSPSDFMWKDFWLSVTTIKHLNVSMTMTLTPPQSWSGLYLLSPSPSLLMLIPLWSLLYILSMRSCRKRRDESEEQTRGRINATNSSP